MLSTRLSWLLLVVIGSVTCHRLAGKCGSKPCEPQKLRLVTWNINDNSGLEKKGIDVETMDMLFFEGKTKRGEDKYADIYAIGFQELCYKCDKKTLDDIPTEFVEQLNKKTKGNYEAFGIKGTREVDDCIANHCKWGKEGNDAHGTTALMVFAKKGVVNHVSKFSFVKTSQNVHCSHKNNDEKGVAYMRLELSTKKSVCVATSHLDSDDAPRRKECLRDFLKDADTKAQWSSCDFKFISGDFNTRTAADKDMESPALKKDTADEATVKQIKPLDELVGKNAYAKDNTKDAKGNMLDYLNAVQKTVYDETPVLFDPTYKIDNKNPANPAKYGKDRPLSWCDRVIHNGGKSIEYTSISKMPAKKSDHFPVFEEFELS